METFPQLLGVPERMVIATHKTFAESGESQLKGQLS